MSRREIDSTLRSLAHSQGFYGRLVAGHYGDYDSILDWLAFSVKPETALDVIYALES